MIITKSNGRMWLFLLLLTAACQKEGVIDQEAPVIHLDAEGVFPKQCQSLQRGNSFVFRFEFSDNMALGTYSLNIHHNFDHHTHSTELLTCALGPEKDPVHPFLFVGDYQIPDGQTQYTAEVPLYIAADVDPGDYHLTITLTDHEGWSTMKGVSIKVTP